VTQGVALAEFEVRATGTDLVKVSVYFPANEDGSPRPGPAPGVVFIQGGFVSTARYSWQAIALAEAGYVVAVPENALQLAFFTVDYGQAARALLAKPPAGSLLEGLVDPQRIAVAGHSLGSVVALKLALQDGFAAVVVEAGFPDTADLSKLPGFTRPSLSLAGELDCSAKLADVRKGWDSIPTSTAFVVLPGVTHFQFTNSDDEDVKRKCVPQASLGDAHELMRGALLGFLAAALADGTVGEPALRAIPGATVEVK
jgi:dienelactone hydrolase